MMRVLEKTQTREERVQAEWKYNQPAFTPCDTSRLEGQMG